MTPILLQVLILGAVSSNPNPLIERLERLERALQIDDCDYAVDELEHLTLSYSDIAFRYGLLAEGYLCTGKPEKARLAVDEFARLGGEPNQLGLRVQEFCALEECAIEPVLVKPVVGQDIVVPEEVLDVRINPNNNTKGSEIVKPTDVGQIIISSRPWAHIQVDGAAAECIGKPNNTTPCPLELSTGEHGIQLEDAQTGTIQNLTVAIQEGSNQNTCWNFTSNGPCMPKRSVETEVALEPVVQEPLDDARIVPKESTTTYTQSSIMGLIEMGQCEEAAENANSWVQSNPNNYTAQMMLGDALACYPFGTGDIYTAFDAWMISKDLAKEQEADFQLMKDRLSWALSKSGIVKIIPELQEGVSSLPDDFNIEFNGQKSVDMDPRTDAMMGGIYLTNLPLGESTLTIHPGGQRESVVHKLDIRSGKLEKIRISISEEPHIAIGSIPTPDGYTVTLIDSSGERSTYDPRLETLLLKGRYEARVQFGDQKFPVDIDLQTEESMRQGLPWVYQIRSSDGAMLSEGLVAPEVDEQRVSVVIETIKIKDSENSITLITEGLVEEMDESLFTEVVLDPDKHPYYQNRSELEILTAAFLRSEVRDQWGVGAMAASGFWTVASAVRSDELSDEPDSSRVWGTQAVIGSLTTMSLVGIWMVQQIKGNPHEMALNQLIKTLELYNNQPVPFTDLIPAK